MRCDLEISWHDLIRATAGVGGVVALLGLVYTGFTAFPGVVWAGLLALAAGFLEHWRKCRHGRASYRLLQGLSKAYVGGAFCSVLAALVLPALAPEDGFEHVGWLVWLNGVLLAGGLLAVPMAQAILTVSCSLAKGRQRTKRSG